MFPKFPVSVLLYFNNLKQMKVKKHSIEKNEISRNKFNQGDKKCIHWKLYDIDKKTKRKIKSYLFLVD